MIAGARVRVVRWIAAVLFVLAIPSVAFAQDAKALKADGDAAMDRLDFQQALDKYNQAYDKSHDPAILYNRARALQSLNRMPEALDELERFDREAPADLKGKVPLGQLLGEYRGRVGVISLKTDVAGARVLVDGKLVGTTPLPGDKVRINTGHVTIEVVAEGYETFREVRDVGAGPPVVVEPKLTSKTTVLVVQADPQATSSELDGKPGRPTPFELGVDPGRHVLVLHRDGYYDLSSTTDVGVGERKILQLKLEGKPVTTKWWFWTTLVGTVLVGAGSVVLGIALTTERAADRGDIQPGQVPAP
jgi:hypothetical protein